MLLHHGSARSGEIPGNTHGYKRLTKTASVYPVNHSQWIEILTSWSQPDVLMAAVAFTTRDAAGVERYLQLNLFDPDLTRVEYMDFTPAREPCCYPFVDNPPGPEEDK
jgi:hypothetical protein